MNNQFEKVTKNEIIIFDYIGVMNQNLITAMTEILRKNSSSSDLFTVFIDLLQIISNYKISYSSKDLDMCFVKVSFIDGEYNVFLKKILKKDKKIELKKSYFEGICFYEIIKRCEGFEYEFEELNKQEYQFSIKVTLK